MLGSICKLRYSNVDFCRSMTLPKTCFLYRALHHLKVGTDLKTLGAILTGCTTTNHFQ